MNEQMKHSIKRAAHAAARANDAHRDPNYALSVIEREVDHFVMTKQRDSWNITSNGAVAQYFRTVYEEACDPYDRQQWLNELLGAV